MLGTGSFLLYAMISGPASEYSPVLPRVSGRGVQLTCNQPRARANFYRLARPELAALRRAAEQLLAGVGHDVELCGNYGDPCHSDTAPEARP
jgi:hypothetical protein